MIRVLHYTHSSGLGGVTDLSLDLIKYSDRKDFQFIVASHTGDERTEVEFKALGVEYHKEVAFNPTAMEWLLKIAKADIVHAQPGANAKCSGMDTALRMGIPVIATIGTVGCIHYDYEGHPLLTVVAGSKSLLRKQVAGARFIYHGIDLDRLHCDNKRQAKEHWGLDPELPVVGWLGRYVAFKSPGCFVGIAKYTQDIDPSVQFIMFGDKDGFEPAKELAEEIGARIHFPGGIRRKDLAYGCMDIGCFPTWGEAFGRVAAEMLGAGVPLICSLCPTNLELCDEHAVYLIPPKHWGDIWSEENYGKMWSYTILALLEEETMRRNMAGAGQIRARELFDARIMARKYNDLYRAIYQKTL